MTRMHADEVVADVALAKRLVAAQMPQWAALSVECVVSHGTDNTLFRLGRDFVMRLPRTLAAAKLVEKESVWLPRLAPHLPVSVPVPLEQGLPTAEYPFRWSVYRWIDGENPHEGDGSFVHDIASFIAALHRIDATDAPRSARGMTLVQRDAATREALGRLTADIDAAAAARTWEAALAAPSDEHTWVHGDLMPGNLLVRDGHLCAVIDFGLVGLGDPACDLMVAWNLLPATARDGFRVAVNASDAVWTRGRGWALSVALIQLPYYRDTNPALANNARRTIAEVLAD